MDFAVGDRSRVAAIDAGLGAGQLLRPGNCRGLRMGFAGQNNYALYGRGGPGKRWWICALGGASKWSIAKYGRLIAVRDKVQGVDFNCGLVVRLRPGLPANRDI